MNAYAPLFLAALLASSAALAQAGDPQPGSLTVTPPASSSRPAATARPRSRVIVRSKPTTLRWAMSAQSVYNEIKREIAAAERECSAGRDAAARAMIVASKKRHGYPIGL